MIEAIKGGLAEEADGFVNMPPRLNVPMQEGAFRVMPVVLNRSGIMGLKMFHGSRRRGARYMVAVFEQERGELLALLDANYLTAARTGATSGVATEVLARPGGISVGSIGSGLEAWTNLAAVAAVRPLRDVSVYSPRQERRERFAARVADHYGVAVKTASSAEECVDGVDLVNVATNTGGAADPIALRGEWLSPGQHVNSIGSTMPALREIDSATIARADVVVVDSPVQVREESGDVLAAVADGVWPEPASLTDLVVGRAGGRTADDQITLFKSVGTALQDVTAGYAVYQVARRTGRGRDVGDFLELKVIQ
jgi:alanine dehydrogenase